jgi:hypothetical protein
LPGEYRHSEFGEIISGEDVDGAAAYHFGGGGEAVAKEAGGVGDDEGAGWGHGFLREGKWD